MRVAQIDNEHNKTKITKTFKSCYNKYMKDLSKLVKALRHNQTIPEQILWRAIRSRRFCGFKFRRQVQIGNYIVDFICYDKNLVIELDGREHLTPEKLEYDANRTAFLEEKNYRVVRYYNTDIFNHLDDVLQDLWNKLQE